MRKMMNKKGFTLVELMIVVVILGILVAIAVPIYSAVTTNAKKKACAGDMRIIRSNLASYVMTGGTDGNMITDSSLLTTEKLYEDNGSFAKMFDNGKTPYCPNSNNSKYSIVFSDPTDLTKFTVTCVAGEACPNNGVQG